VPSTQYLSLSAATTPIDSENHACLDKMRKEGMDKTDPENFCRAYWEAYMKGTFYNPANIGSFYINLLPICLQ